MVPPLEAVGALRRARHSRARVTAKDLTEEDRRRLNGGVERIITKRGAAADELLRALGPALAASIARRRGRSAS